MYNVHVTYPSFEVCLTANRRRSSSVTSSVKRQRSKVEAKEKLIKVDKDKIIQEEVSATGKVCICIIKIAQFDFLTVS